MGLIICIFLSSLAGGAGDDLLHGSDLPDELHGDSGNDTLIGGKGPDDMWGEDGQDVFMYLDGDLDGIQDHIHDFSVAAGGGDTLDLSAILNTDIAVGNEDNYFYFDVDLGVGTVDVYVDPTGSGASSSSTVVAHVDFIDFSGTTSGELVTAMLEHIKTELP